VIAPSDKILFVQTLSKNWAMTGWRIGWLEAPAALGGVIENLVQYSTSGVPVPVQRAATAAIEGGESFIAEAVRRLTRCRDVMVEGLRATGRVEVAAPEGAFYLFPKILGEADMRRLAFRLIDEAGVGVAPGHAFGPGGEGRVRLCFAREVAVVQEATRRLAAWLSR
jgi:aspartate/methionine/tyrosine aminotransferase